MPPKKRTADNGTTKPAKKRKSKKQNNDLSEPESDENCENGAGDKEDVEEDLHIDVTLEGSSLSGELLFAGATNWDLVGRRAVPKGMKDGGGDNLFGANRIESMIGIKIRTAVSNCVAAHSAVITTEGKVHTWGRNEKGQLGHGDTDRKNIPTLVESLSDFNVIDVACGRNHTLFLTEKGQVYACGENKMAQLGLGHQSPHVPSPTRISYKGPPIRKIAAGGDFSFMIDIRGNIYSVGCPEYGQLGNNTDGKYFVTSTKMDFKCIPRPVRVVIFIEKTRDGHVVPIPDVELLDVQCGANHVLMLDTKKRVYTCGFGGYGRLGHAEQKDEMVPRLVKFFDGPNRGAHRIFAGTTFSMAVTELGALYFWGQAKITGEATMYPKPVQDLQGWKIRSVGCGNKSIVVSADESVVSWGPSPTCGELAYGEGKLKSSTVPMEAKPFAGMHIHAVACGFSHTLYIARVESEEEAEKLKKFPVLKP